MALFIVIIFVTITFFVLFSDQIVELIDPDDNDDYLDDLWC